MNESNQGRPMVRYRPLQDEPDNGASGLVRMNNGMGRQAMVPRGGSRVGVPSLGNGGYPYEENNIRTGMQPPPFQEASIRQLAPEDLLGDRCREADSAACDKGRYIRPFVSTVGDAYLEAMYLDYNVIGTVGQARAAVRRMYADETQDVGRTTMVGASPNFNATFAAYPTRAACVGFVIDWGIEMLNYAPFDMQIITSGWINLGGTTLDRNLTVRIHGTVGSSIFVPFAQRTTPSMSIAQMQVAHSGGDGATIQVASLPTNIFSSFSATISLLTAFSPRTAAYAALENIISD